jgi:hypothetical protein
VELTWETKVALRSHPSCYRGSLDLNPGPGGTREASISVQETTAPRLWESWETSICDRNGWREVAPLHPDHKRGWGGERERERDGGLHTNQVDSHHRVIQWRCSNTEGDQREAGHCAAQRPRKKSNVGR